MTYGYTGMLPAKNYHVIFTSRDGYLHANAEGFVPTSEVMIGLWSDVARECADTGNSRILFVDSFQRKATLEAISDLVSSPVMESLRNLAIAVVSDRNRLENEFGVYLAQQKGLNARFFDSEEYAVEWLTGRRAPVTTVK